MDGLTTVLTCQRDGHRRRQPNHIKLAIADASDSALDSAVFLQAGSLTSGGKISARGTVNDTSGAAVQLSAANDCTESQSTRGFNVRWARRRIHEDLGDDVRLHERHVTAALACGVQQAGRHGGGNPDRWRHGNGELGVRTAGPEASPRTRCHSPSATRRTRSSSR